MMDQVFSARFQSKGFHKFAHSIDKLIILIMHDEVPTVPDNDMK